MKNIDNFINLLHYKWEILTQKKYFKVITISVLSITGIVTFFLITYLTRYQPTTIKLPQQTVVLPEQMEETSSDEMTHSNNKEVREYAICEVADLKDYTFSVLEISPIDVDGSRYFSIQHKTYYKIKCELYNQSSNKLTISPESIFNVCDENGKGLSRSFSAEYNSEISEFRGIVGIDGILTGEYIIEVPKGTQEIIVNLKNLNSDNQKCKYCFKLKG